MEFNHDKYDKKRISSKLQYMFFCLFVCLSTTIMSIKPILCNWSLSILSESILMKYILIMFPASKLKHTKGSGHILQFCDTRFITNGTDYHWFLVKLIKWLELV